MGILPIPSLGHTGMIISLANRIEIPKLNILKKMCDQIIKCDKKYLSRKFGHSEELAKVDMHTPLARIFHTPNLLCHWSLPLH